MKRKAKSRRANLSREIRNVPKKVLVKGYRCPFCTKIGIQQAAHNVRQHIRAKHPEEEEPTIDEMSVRMDETLVTHDDISVPDGGKSNANGKDDD